MENNEASPEKKAKYFCTRTFRDELKGSDALKSMKKFISAAQNNEEVILEYMENGGSISEIFSLIDETAKRDLTTALPVFEIAHLILLKFQLSNSKYHQHCIDGAKCILRIHIPTIQSLLSMKTSKHQKVALKLLTAIVTLQSSFSNEVLNLFSPMSTLINDLILPTPEKDSVRKYFILFVLSFLIEGNPTALKTLMDKKGFLSIIIPGLKFDEATTVNMTLSLLEEKVLKNLKIPKTLKLKTFNTQIIKSLFDLYEWNGPQVLKKYLPGKKKKHNFAEVNQKDKALVTDSVHSFLLVLCTSKKYGVAFSDKSLGTSETTNNQLLLSVFEGLSNPLGNNKIAEIILKTLIDCPDLVKPTLLKLEPFFQPRNSKNWFDIIEFSENLINELNVASLIETEREIISSNEITKVTKILCAPIPLLRTVKSGALKSQPIEVRIYSLKLLSTMWNATQNVIKAFHKVEAGLKKSVENFIAKFLPDCEEVVELWHDLCDEELLSKFSLEQRSFFLPVTLKSLEIIVECQPDTISSPIWLASYLLQQLDKIKETIRNEDFVNNQAKIVQLMNMDIKLLTPDMDLFKTSLLISLRSSDVTLLSSASKILSNLKIFLNDRSVIDVWLLCLVALPLESRNAVAECLVDSVSDPTVSFHGNENFYQVDSSMPDCYKRKTETKKNSNFEENELFFFIKCMDMLKSYTSNPSENSAKIVSFQQYLSDVIIQLQHWYPHKNFSQENFKVIKKLPDKSVVNYLKCWTSNSLSSSNLGLFLCPYEREVAVWLLNEQDSRGIEKIINMNLEIFKLYRLFKMIIAHLIVKITHDNLTESNCMKFLNGLSFFLKSTTLFEYDGDNCLLSYELKNHDIYYKKCIDCIFSDNSLFKLFNIFVNKKNTVYYCSMIVVRALMENEIIKKIVGKKLLVEDWKVKFLNQLKKKFQKNQSIEDAENFNVVLNFFEYQHDEAVDMVILLTNVSDFHLFLDNNVPSKWTTLLVKFLQIYCLKNKLNDKIMQKLCFLMKYFNKMKCSDFDILDNCFVSLLEKYPEHLLLIENGFLEIILQRKHITPSIITLGKLLLNDPVKVKHFLAIASDYIDSELIFPLLSVLLINDEPFFEVLKSKNALLVWNTCEISRESSPELLKLLENIYKKYEKSILCALKGENESVVLQNLTVTQGLIKLFVDKNVIKLFKKDIRKGKFQPELLLEVAKKFPNESSIMNYLKGFISKFCETIKNSELMEENIWVNYASIVSKFLKSFKNSEYENILGSSEWKEFFKLSVGVCFKTSKYPSLLKIIRMFIAFCQPKEDSKVIAFYFQMIISHSQFLNVILKNSPLKRELVELYYILVEQCPTEMSSKHIPLLLASYTASICPSDQILLKILKLYEKNGFKFTDYEPLVWGETAISHYSIGTPKGLSLWQQFNMTNVLDLLDSQKLEISLKEFPIYRSLEVNQTSGTDSDDNIYDPAFLLPLFVNLLSPGSLVFPLPFVYRGALAYTIRALSSECSDVRKVASVVLMRFYNHLELNQNLKQKLVWMHFVDCFRYGIEDLSIQAVPNIVTLFFARMTIELTQQPAEMHQPLQNFLLAKSYFSFDSVPEFLPLFHSSNISFRKQRQWLLQVLKDGTKTDEDVKIIFYSMAFKVIFSFFHSQLCDVETKKLILQVMDKVITVKHSVLLISDYGLLSWINSIDTDSYKPILLDLVQLLFTSSNLLVEDIKIKNQVNTNLTNVIQVLNILMKILPAINLYKSIELFNTYLKIVFNCMSLFINQKENEWFVLNKHKLQEIIDTGFQILRSDFSKFCKVPFYYREYNNNNIQVEANQNLKNAVFIFHLLMNKQIE